VFELVVIYFLGVVTGMLAFPFFIAVWKTLEVNVDE